MPDYPHTKCTFRKPGVYCSAHLVATPVLMKNMTRLWINESDLRSELKRVFGGQMHSASPLEQPVAVLRRSLPVFEQIETEGTRDRSVGGHSAGVGDGEEPLGFILRTVIDVIEKISARICCCAPHRTGESVCKIVMSYCTLERDSLRTHIQDRLIGSVSK